jgi:hypothetical protein
MKFVDKEIQEDFDNIPEDRKQKYINEWLARHPKKPKVLFVKEWLFLKKNAERIKKEEEKYWATSLLPTALNISAKSLADELESFTPKPTHGLKFEIIDGKVKSTVVKINKD